MGRTLPFSRTNRKREGSREDNKKNSSVSSATTLVDRWHHLAKLALAKRTRESYATAVNRYIMFMDARSRNHEDPSVKDLCLWISQESLFIQSESILKYVAGVRYHLDTYGKGHVARDILVGRVVRGICKKYGLGKGKDAREPLALELLIKILRAVNLDEHDERCCAAACVIGFLNCLRIGEFTVSKEGENCLKRSDWKNEGERGSIRLRKCKTDIFGRGHDLKYRRMKSLLDPVFWMDTL